MSSYSTTATVTGTPVVRANPTGGPDTRDPDVVEVARNGLETHARDVVRVTIAQGNGVEATAYLARETAEELAVELLRAADLLLEDPQPGPVLAGGIGAESHPIGPRAGDRALRVVERAVSEATAIGVLRTELLGRVANGLTGSVNGHRERLIAQRMAAAVDTLPDVTQEQARSIAAYGFDTTPCEAAGRHVMREPSEVTTPGGGHDADRCPANPLVGDRLKVTR